MAKTVTREEAIAAAEVAGRFLSRTVRVLAASVVVMLTTKYLAAAADVGVALGYLESLAAVITARALLGRAR